MFSNLIISRWANNFTVGYREMLPNGGTKLVTIVSSNQIGNILVFFWKHENIVIIFMQIVQSPFYNYSGLAKFSVEIWFHRGKRLNNIKILLRE